MTVPSRTESSDQRVCARIVAAGRVQGVFYRDTLRRAAIERHVDGSAVNRADGSVLALLEGTRADVDAVVKIARGGPPAAQVERFDVEWIEPAGAEGFRIG